MAVLMHYKLSWTKTMVNIGQQKHMEALIQSKHLSRVTLMFINQPNFFKNELFQAYLSTIFKRVDP